VSCIVASGGKTIYARRHGESVRSSLRAAIGAIAALAGAVALAGPALAQEPIRIGFHVPLTGFAAGDGKSAQLAGVTARLGIRDVDVWSTVLVGRARARRQEPAQKKRAGEIHPLAHGLHRLSPCNHAKAWCCEDLPAHGCAAQGRR
jgi:hypothetical protein